MIATYIIFAASAGIHRKIIEALAYNTAMHDHDDNMELDMLQISWTITFSIGQISPGHQPVTLPI